MYWDSSARFARSRSRWRTSASLSRSRPASGAPASAAIRMTPPSSPACVRSDESDTPWNHSMICWPSTHSAAIAATVVAMRLRQQEADPRDRHDQEEARAARRAAAGDEERRHRHDVEGHVDEGLGLQARPARLQQADADDAGREPGDQHIEIECRRLGAERLRLGREQGERDQHRGNREAVEVEESQHAPGELGIASRSLDFRRHLHGGTLPRDPRPTRGAARVCDAVQGSR